MVVGLRIRSALEGSPGDTADAYPASSRRKKVKS